MITINNQQFENNPTGVNPNTIFMGTVHTGTGIQENVYGFNFDQVVETAKKLKELNPDFNIVHVYGPYDFLCIKREYIGYKLL